MRSEIDGVAKSGLTLSDKNQAIESQIVRLSFEFAKADVALAKTVTSPHDAVP
jgi:hypothetical protein